MTTTDPAIEMPPLRLVQISDTHLYATADGALLGLETRQSLQRTLELIQTRHWPADLLLVTGDLVHDGSVEGYRWLRDRLAQLRIPVHYLAGNHDNGENLHRTLNGSGVRVVDSATHREWALILLDSTIPGENGGHLGEETLAQLEQRLAETRDRQVLVCLHHNPVPMGSRWLDTMTVDNPDALFERLDRAPQVRGILWGHVHQAYDAQRGGVRLLACPSTCIQFAPGSEHFGLDSAPPGYRWLELYPDGRIETGVERLDAYPGGLDPNAKGY